MTFPFPASFYAYLLSTLASGATTSPGLAYWSNANPSEIVANMIVGEK